jgi:hypothetical protein
MNEEMTGFRRWLKRAVVVRRSLAVAAVAVSAVANSAPDPGSLLRDETLGLLKEAAIAPDSAFATALLASLDWQHELLDSGPLAGAAPTLATLHAIWTDQPDLATRPVDRSMATACALEAPRRNMAPEEMLVRYRFFLDRHRRGELNTIYDNLSTFDRRFLARGVQHTGFNSLESMDYLVAEVALPAPRYTGACWYAAYRGHNAFGDTVQGPLYYAPFADSWGSHAERVSHVGGVCGSLSNFGAAAAIANGVPAVTMGEPGHCAYAVLTAPGRWQPAYSLSWQRGMHTAFDGSTWGWHRLITEAMKDPVAARRSGDLRRLARHQLARAAHADARRTIRLARTRHPLDWPNWTLSAEILAAPGAPEGDWQDLHRDLLAHLAPVSGECAHHFLTGTLYPRILPAGDSALDARRRILLAYHQAVSDWGLGRWDFGRALDDQLKRLGGPPETGDDFLARVFARHAAGNVFTSEILALQMRRAGDQGDRLKQFIATIGRSLSSGGGGSSDTSAVIDTLAATVLPKAAAQGDRETFQFIGRLTAKNYEPHPLSPESFPGMLLSSGGTFGIQKPGNRWDTPARHWGVIEEHGGDFHTDAKPATATIQLGNFGRLSGVVIVTRGGNVGRLNGAILQASTDGETWTDLHTFGNVSQVQRIDLQDRQIDAGFVRVIHHGHPSLHFHKFLVYGHKQN